MKIRSTWNQFAKEYALPLFLEYLIFALLTFLYNFVSSKGGPVQQAIMVGSEMSSPTLGRLIYGGAAFVLFFVFATIASKAAAKENDIQSFWCGFTAGILLWQVFGEVIWHFSAHGIHFTPMESASTLPLAILFIVLLVYGKRHHSFDWGIWCMLLTFVCNWLGRYIMVGTGPFVKQWFDTETWNHRVSIIVGIALFLYSIGFFLFRAKTTKGRMQGSLLTFISTVVIYFGLT